MKVGEEAPTKIGYPEGTLPFGRVFTLVPIFLIPLWKFSFFFFFLREHPPSSLVLSFALKLTSLIYQTISKMDTFLPSSSLFSGDNGNLICSALNDTLALIWSNLEITSSFATNLIRGTYFLPFSSAVFIFFSFISQVDKGFLVRKPLLGTVR